MKKRFLACILLVCLMVSLAACGSTPATDSKEEKEPDVSEAPQEPSVVKEEDFRITTLEDDTCVVSYCDSEVQTIVVPDTLYGYKVVGIGSFAFNQCPAETIVLPDTVEFIEANTFTLCENLKNIELGSGLKRIGQLAFLGCHSLETVVFPDGMTAIESFCFGNCPVLKEVIIPASVTEIPNGITNIDQCPNIKIVTPAGSAAEQAALNSNLPVENR